ncbi:MAG: glycosyltransferase [Lachnospiraceae bacterium]|nr:glycosyltransferase [Lachnospiraceae bacterium]
MANEKQETCKEILAFVKQIRENLEKSLDMPVLFEQVETLGRVLPVVISLLDNQDKEQYEDYIISIKRFCDKFRQIELNDDNLTMFFESLKPLIDTLAKYAEKGQYRCSCCGSRAGFAPLASYYTDMSKKYNAIEHISETLNVEHYTCRKCGASDRDRLIIQFLREIEANLFSSEKRLLQFAPAQSIEKWIINNCTKIKYESTDLFMDGVSFKADVQDLSDIEDETYDFWISSHVLEHVQDDKKAMREMRRILKDDGIGIFLVPISIDVDYIDEEWGLDESENWRRFGQNDHCRMYGKQALVKRLEECGFCVNEYNKDFISEEIFDLNAFVETSTLYILTKQKVTLEEIFERFQKENELSKDDAPLVSVCMSAYNHEPFVEEAILSVLNQTYKNIEFIVGDDCSPDGTAEIMKKYSEFFAYELYSDVNYHGLEGILIPKAKGKYICLMNSDDIWEPDKIEKQVRFMENNPDYGACFTWCEYVNEDLEMMESDIFMVENRTQYEWLRKFFLQGNCLCHPSIMIKNAIYKGLIIPENGRYRQLPDFYMWVKLVQRENLYVLPDAKVKMRRYDMEGRKNTSAASVENNYRSMNETMSIWYSEIKNMKADVFVKAFEPYLNKKDISSESEIRCEKYFLLKRMDLPVYKMAAMMLFYEWYVDEDFRKCLYEEYKYDLNDFYKLSSMVMPVSLSTDSL